MAPRKRAAGTKTTSTNTEENDVKKTVSKGKIDKKTAKEEEAIKDQKTETVVVKKVQENGDAPSSKPESRTRAQRAKAKEEPTTTERENVTERRKATKRTATVAANSVESDEDSSETKQAKTVAPKKKPTKKGGKAVKETTKAENENSEESEEKTEEKSEQSEEKLTESPKVAKKTVKNKKKDAKTVKESTKTRKENDESPAEELEEDQKSEQIEEKQSAEEQHIESTKVAKKTAKNKRNNVKTVKETTKAEKENEEEKPEEGLKEHSEEQQIEPPKVAKKTQKDKKNNVAVEEDTTSEKIEKKGRGRKAAANKPTENDKDTLKNTTTTKWTDIDFTTTRLNASGKAYNIHLQSWNVDGVRAWVKKGGLEILKYAQPNVLCLQETKCSLEKLPEEMTNVEGYKPYWSSCENKEGYSGVGILTKIMPIEVHYGIDDDEFENDGRCITAEFKYFYLINVYVPNAGRNLVTLPKRLKWNQLFKDYVKRLDEKKPVIVCGDLNVAHNEIDLTNPKTNVKHAGFTFEEREGMSEFLGDGYIDTFRKFYPDKTGAYTFWTYLAKARAKNVGWRLDYYLVSERIMDNVCDNKIHPEVYGSDHCPLSLYLRF